MKQLNRIVLVNWYMLGAVEIPVRGNVAIVGPNGSGKSSILDAVQTVLMGGNKQWLSFNASAGERSERSLRTYCLGYLDETDASGRKHHREDAITYLALSFKDQQTGEETAMGMALTTSLSNPDEDILGRFILPNFSICLDDFTVRQDGGRIPRSWDEVRESLRNRCEGMVIEKRARHFLKQVMVHLSHDPNFPNDEDKFVKNFKNAIKFSPIDSPTRFIREYVLDQNIVHVGAFRKSLEEYRAMEAKTREVAKRLEELDKIQDQDAACTRHAKNGGEYEWVVHEARFEQADLKKEETAEKLDLLREQEGEMQAGLEAMSAAVEKVMEQVAEHRASLNNTDSIHKIRALESNLESRQHAMNSVKAKLTSQYDVLRATVAFAKYETLLPANFLETVKTAVGLWREGEGLAAAEWPQHPVEVDKVIGALRKQVDGVRQQVAAQAQETVIQLNRMKQDLQESRDAIDQMKQGKAPLKRNTQELIALLAEYGIDSTPLCELVDVTDEKWRLAIESFLGGRREALMVDADKVQDAVTLYRRKGRHLKNCRIVNTRQTSKWLSRGDDRSLLQFVSCRSDDAQAYINRALGGVIAVETEAELLKQERAITPDCMLQSEGSTTSIREESPMLGGGQRESRLDNQGKAFETMVTEYQTLEQSHQQLEGLRESIIKLATRLTADNETAFALCNERLQLESDMDGLRTSIEELRNLEDGPARQRLEEAIKEQQARQADQRKAMDKLQSLKTECIKLEAGLEVLENELQEHGQARQRCAEREGFDAQSAQEKRDYLDESCVGELERIIFESARKAQSELQSSERKRNGIRDLVAEYKARYHANTITADQVSHLNGEASHEELMAFVGQQSTLLRESELATYQKQAERARQEAETAFRSDFVAHLNDQIDKIKGLIKEINQHLKQRPFHREMYAFSMQPNPELKDVLELVETFSRQDQANVGSLFDSAIDEDSPHKLALEKIHQVLQDEGEAHLLQDYRNFYNFELNVMDLEGNHKTTLTQRIKTGSGGEHQVPFYVAIAAALAATYRLREGHEGQVVGGFSLSLFDEAFNKLDSANTQTSLGFMTDLGLQAMIAAPDDKYSLMSSTMDTIINVCRDGNVVDLDVEFPTEAGKALLNSDSPYRLEQAAAVG
ncbi:SbcC/MukB-like Walker B domain-containing protein [Pokkaliibacter sp. CJK22405]|uniref:SbcC/MukB-like Walker B domain-containing protein n=1 Tax=Pokkaliibacter sp. CJK22405 TaxID=3384615 RepID=UPI0039850D4F